MGAGKSEYRVRVKIRCCSGHDHEVCVKIHRAVHPDLRCSPIQSAGYTHGGGGCVLPPDLVSRVDFELRNHYQESRRRGWVDVAA